MNDMNMNKFLLVGDKFMPGMHLRLTLVIYIFTDLHRQDLHIVLVHYLYKTRKKYKNSKKQEILDIFI